VHGCSISEIAPESCVSALAHLKLIQELWVDLDARDITARAEVSCARYRQLPPCMGSGEPGVSLIGVPAAELRSAKTGAERTHRLEGSYDGTDRTDESDVGSQQRASGISCQRYDSQVTFQDSWYTPTSEIAERSSTSKLLY